MASVVDAKYSTLIGTYPQLVDLLRVLRGQGAAVVDLKFSNFVVLDEPLTPNQLAMALRVTPEETKR